MEKTIQQEAKDSMLSFLKTHREVRRELDEIEEDDDALIEEKEAEIYEALEVATGRDFNGTRTYMVLLGTGGPAMRITGDLDENGYPETADYQYQDWFTPWTSGHPNTEDEELLLDFAQHFNFEGREE